MKQENNYTIWIIIIGMLIMAIKSNNNVITLMTIPLWLYGLTTNLVEQFIYKKNK